MFQDQKRSALRLVCGASLIALAAAGSVAAQTPTSDVQEVVVTGTRIRGVAPVGSPVIGLGTEQIEKTGVASTIDVLRRLPQVSSLGADDTLSGGSTIQNSIINISLSRSVNLRGLGTTATLGLVNGRRVAPGGVNAAVFDADAIPAAFLQRVEVVPDGASAIYGSDAVAGVVNYVTRRRFDGLQTTARYGGSADSNNWLGSAIWGKTWDSGNFSISYERAHRDALAASDRPDLYNDNIVAYGGAAGAVNSDPGNVTIGTTVYAVPRNQRGAPLLLSQLSAPGVQNYQSVWDQVDAVPEQDRYSIAAAFDQDLGGSFKLFVDGFYSRREFTRRSTAAAGNGLTVPANSPFNPCNTANSQTNNLGISCAGQTVRVNYSFLNDLGPATQTGYQQLWAGTTGLRFDVGPKWKGEVAYTRSEAADFRRTYNQLNTTALNQALNPTTAATAGITPLNLFCDGDAIKPCNSQATLNYFRGVVLAGSEYVFNDYTVKFDGPLFDLPGGTVRVAVGGEYHDDSLVNTNINNTTTANVQTYVQANPRITRNVSSVFGELYVPIIGSGNATPWAKALEFVVAGRYEDYSDFGSTTNPKLGLRWVPVDGFKVNASYGTSFRAPTLCDINEDCTTRYANTTITPADLTAVGLTGTGRTYFLTGGGRPGLDPETADTYSVGFELSPSSIPGLSLTASYYNISYKNRIGTPGETAGIVTAVNDPNYRVFTTYNPTFFPTLAAAQGTTQASFNTLINSFATSPRYTGGPVNQATVVAVVDGRRQNSGVLKTDGIDFTGGYDFDVGGGTMHVGGNATYVLSYDTAPVVGQALADQNNRFGYGLRFKARGELGWSGEKLSVTGFLNYSNPYKLGREFTLAAAPAQYLKIDAYTTFDATASYDFGEDASFALGKGLRATLSVQNLFNEDPPFVLNSAGSAILFDPGNASALGRTWSVQLTKKW